MISDNTNSPVRLLLVDDDDVDRLAVTTALASTDRSIRVTEAADATRALTLLLQESFDCVMADLVMPGRDGLWLLEHARAVDLPFIMLTGKGDEDVAVEIMKAGATDYLPKSSVSPSSLSLSVRQAIRVKDFERAVARSARSLEESEKRLRLALDATGLGTWDLDLKTGSFACDIRSRTVLGLASDASTNLAIFLACLHAGDRNDVERALRDAVESRAEHCDIECRTVREGWVRVSGRVFSENGGPVRVVGTLQDVSEARESEEQARRRKDFDQQMLGIVSHDLRNPISAMLMAAAGLFHKSSLDERTSKALVRIISSGERASRMIQDLLDFTRARIGGGIPIQPRPSDLHDIATEVVEELRVAFPNRRIDLETNGDGRGEWDSDRLAQILTNLLRNALAYSPASSTVRVTTIGAEDRVTLAVHNDGDPIPEKVRTVLFEPFIRGPDEAPGRDRSIGLGLFIVRELVTTHGGTVEVSSSAADGTTFVVEFPVRDGNR